MSQAFDGSAPARIGSFAVPDPARQAGMDYGRPVHVEILTHEPQPSSVTDELPHTFADLERRLHAVEPAALLVLPRILRRIIKLDRDLIGLGLKVPHRKTYIISRQRLAEFAEPSELGLASLSDLPDPLLLLARPEPEDIEKAPAAVLLRIWRLLFHLRVHAVLAGRIANGQLSAEALRQHIKALGPAVFSEIQSVLRQEDFLLPPRDDLHAFVEFAAVYLELHYFAPSLLESYFPAIQSHHSVQQVLACEVDAPTLLIETRLAGSPPSFDRAGPVEEHLEESPSLVPAAPAGGRDDQARRLLRRAERVAAMGNVVRSAILRTRAAGCASPRLAESARIEAQADMDRLVHRLQSALEIRQSDPRPWREALLALVAGTSRGIWTAEARLLYDLQKVCVDYERDIYTVDLVQWALSWGKEPIQRPLPSQREVLMSKHLHRAARRLAAVRIPESRRKQLAELLQIAAVRAEVQLRDRFRPLIAAALDDVGLKPANVPERVAQKKLIEELLDRVVSRGFLRMGDLRDALSRNNLKLPDFAGIEDFLRGDQLLRIDRRLGTLLDGVYERGEVYLRGMQQLSSLAFGTRVGRFLSQYVVIPFGGAFVILEFAQHVVKWIPSRHIDRAVPDSVARGVLRTAHHAVHGLELNTVEYVLALGTFLLLLLHVGPFRQALLSVVRWVGRLARRAFIDFPRWAYRQPLVQAVFHSRPFELTMRYLVKPLAFTVLVGLFVPLHRIPPTTLAGSGLAIFLGMNLLLNSPLGRQLQEVAVDWLVQAWHRFGLRILTGLFYLVMDVFRSVLEAIERLLYTVDEWLRFKSGESRFSLVAKGVLGLIWFFVTYVVRFCVNLLIEPQINPIKHFPVVTVSHKVLLGFIPPLAGVLSLTMARPLAVTVATVVITSIPGIFGFLVWELKENWRLYAANRPKNLGPVPIGHHGETMARLLKPGFHSGTVPKLYARLRRAERKARLSDNWKPTRKHRLALHHVQLAIRRYVQREFIELLQQSRAWQGPRVSLGRIEIASNQVLIELQCPELQANSLWIALGQRAGWLMAEVVHPGWSCRLLPQQRRVLNSALLGLYKTGSVDLVREQILGQINTQDELYVREDGLLLSSIDSGRAEVFYPLTTAESEPRILTGRTARTWPTLLRWQLLFRDQPISWQQWVATWEQDSAGQNHPRELFAAHCVVPDSNH